VLKLQFYIELTSWVSVT